MEPTVIVAVAGRTEIAAMVDFGDGSALFMEPPPPHPDNAIAAIRISKRRSEKKELAGSAVRETVRSLNNESSLSPYSGLSSSMPHGAVIVTVRSRGVCDLRQR